MQNLPVDSAIRDRRSVRRFGPGALPDGVLEELLETAIHAPNHRHTEPWRFVVVRGDARQRLADLRAEIMAERAEADNRPMKDPAQKLREITEPQAIVYVVQRLSADPKEAKEDYASCAIVAYILQLAAWERGLGAKWHSGELTAHPKVREFLGLSEDEAAVTFLAIGYPAEDPRDWEQRPAGDVTRYID